MHEVLSMFFWHPECWVIDANSCVPKESFDVRFLMLVSQRRQHQDLTQIKKLQEPLLSTANLKKGRKADKFQIQIWREQTLTVFLKQLHPGARATFRILNLVGDSMELICKEPHGERTTL